MMRMMGPARARARAPPPPQRPKKPKRNRRQSLRSAQTPPCSAASADALSRARALVGKPPAPPPIADGPRPATIDAWLRARSSLTRDARLTLGHERATFASSPCASPSRSNGSASASATGRST